MKLKYTIIICMLLLVGCNDSFLDEQPLSDVTVDNFFLKESDLELYTNGFYRMFPSTAIYDGDAVADNIVETTLSEEMRSARTIPTTGGGWDWEYLRDINYFLRIMKNVKMKQQNCTMVELLIFLEPIFIFKN